MASLWCQLLFKLQCLPCIFLKVATEFWRHCGQSWNNTLSIPATQWKQHVIYLTVSTLNLVIHTKTHNNFSLNLMITLFINCLFCEKIIRISWSPGWNFQIACFVRTWRYSVYSHTTLEECDPFINPFFHIIINNIFNALPYQHYWF